MLFPWKRMKSAKISRLVNDHLHKSQKRRDGCSLVVETGFPTSLVDLFMKNREKLKKSSKRKRQSPPLTPLTGANDPIPDFASPPTSPLNQIISAPIAGSETPPINRSLELSNSPILISRVCSEENPVVESSDGDDSGGVKRAFFVFIKMFLVVILALGTKRLTVGITISAFLLLFLEFVLKHLCGSLKLILNSEGVLTCMFQRICMLSRFKNGEPPVPVNQEIQIVEVKDDSWTRLDEIQSGVELESCSEGITGCQEIEYKESKEDPNFEVMESKKIKSRRAKIKLKMKKLFPKRLRSSRKEDEPQRLQIVKEIVPCDKQEDAPQRLQIVEEIVSCDKQDLRLKSRNEISPVCGLSKISEETTTKNQEKREETKSGLTWGYLFLCLIVLAGLIGGRGFALLLTLSWCLLLKLGEKFPRFIKLPG